jgi:hypothetical protein
MLLLVGLPIAVEILTMYVLIGLETPLTPLVRRLQQNGFGIFALACFGLVVVCVVMFAVLSMAERRHRRRSAARGASAG